MDYKIMVIPTAEIKVTSIELSRVLDYVERNVSLRKKHGDDIFRDFFGHMDIPVKHTEEIWYWAVRETFNSSESLRLTPSYSSKEILEENLDIMFEKIEDWFSNNADGNIA